MKYAIGMVALIWICSLIWEAVGVRRARAKVSHVVHVNGTRGKSTVSRLIEAGLRAGGLSVFCKTTGTDPITIDVNGVERPVLRRGKPNIKEQIRILRQAARQGAQVLVVECMAVQPELQFAAQHQILRGDIGVITNVRWDHTDVMGKSLEEIGTSLSNTVPRAGILFTAETDTLAPLQARAEKLDTPVRCVRPDGSEPAFDFPENIALALAVCEYLGVDRETALAGMANYRRDPYALSVHTFGPSLWINGFSINDIQSTCLVYERLKHRLGLEGRQLIVLVNNRGDRGSRTEDMLQVCLRLAPSQVWLMGAGKGYMRRKLGKLLPQAQVAELSHARQLTAETMPENAVVFAIGNIAHEGRAVMEILRREGVELVY